MILIKSEKKSYGINFPTSKEEITPEVLNTITDGIKLPPHYCIIALCFQTKVFDFVAVIKSQRNNDVAVTPVLAKIHDEDSNVINAKVGDRVIINRSSLERGNHLNLPISISSNAARNYFASDPELVRAIMTKSDKDKVNEDILSAKFANIIILEFKIVPVNDITAAIPMVCDKIDPFIVKFNDIN